MSIATQNNPLLNTTTISRFDAGQLGCNQLLAFWFVWYNLFQNNAVTVWISQTGPYAIHTTIETQYHITSGRDAIINRIPVTLIR
jgi:hypothetical protein